MCVPALALVGCNSENKVKAINMTRYFEQKVNYQVYNRNAINDNLRLDSFIDDKFDTIDNSGNELMKQYTSITFNGVKDWLYKMYVEEVDFYIYSNLTMEIQFEVKISNLKTKKDAIPVPVNLVAGKAVPVRVVVQDYFDNYTSSSTINIAPQDRIYFIVNGEETGLKYDLSRLAVYGYHSADKWN